MGFWVVLTPWAKCCQSAPARESKEIQPMLCRNGLKCKYSVLVHVEDMQPNTWLGSYTTVRYQIAIFLTISIL